MEDLHQRVRRLEEALAAAERTLALALDHAPIGMALFDLDGRFIRVNDSLCGFLGRSSEQLHSISVHEVSHPDDLVRHLDLWGRTLAGEVPGFRLEQRFVRPDASDVWGELSVAFVRDETGEPLHCIAQVVDVTERRAEADRLRRQAQRDPLTGLDNRASVDAALRFALDDARTQGRRVGVLFIDLDRFKPINDELGHAVGDAVLREIAVRLRHVIRPGDTVGR